MDPLFAASDLYQHFFYFPKEYEAQIWAPKVSNSVPTSWGVSGVHEVAGEFGEFRAEEKPLAEYTFLQGSKEACVTGQPPFP